MDVIKLFEQEATPVSVPSYGITRGQKNDALGSINMPPSYFLAWLLNRVFDGGESQALQQQIVNLSGATAFTFTNQNTSAVGLKINMDGNDNLSASSFSVAIAGDHAGPNPQPVTLKTQTFKADAQNMELLLFFAKADSNGIIKPVALRPNATNNVVVTITGVDGTPTTVQLLTDISPVIERLLLAQPHPMMMPVVDDQISQWGKFFRELDPATAQAIIARAREISASRR